MIFAAGLGTRLKPFTDHHPKALALVNDKTLLEHAIRYLQRYGISDIVINVHHFAEQIEALLEEENGFGSRISISDERGMVLETGGGLKKAAHFFSNEDFVVMNVDIMTSLDLDRLINAHRRSGALATLAVMQRESTRELLFDREMQLCAWHNKNSGEIKTARECIQLSAFSFSGIHVIHTDIFPHITQEGKFSIIDTYLQLAASLPVKGFDHSGDVLIDVGKPGSLDKASWLFPSSGQ
jgi:N-acetyl-alpha-D-muramate 1-phosphate uridylyltransferase